jgi:hypothetical protein
MLAFMQIVSTYLHFISALHDPWCHLFLVYDG